jgi:hypothetical protein
MRKEVADDSRLPEDQDESRAGAAAARGSPILSPPRFTINVSALVAVFLIIAGWHWVVVTVPAGFVAVKYHRFAGGTDVQTTYGEGSHVKLPWDKVATYPGGCNRVAAASKC